MSTTVATAYTAGSGTLVVASATGMPATGTFRLRLGNVAGSILICQSRVGTTLTVTVEQDDGNALAGDTVRLVNTAGSMEQLKADAIAGSGGASGLPPLDQSGWAWLNQDAASVAVVGDLTRLTVPNDSVFHLRVTAAPATPYTVTVLMEGALFGNTIFGVALVESATSKLISLNANISAGGVNTPSFRKHTNPDTFSSQSILTIPIGWTRYFLRVGDDGTNVTFEYSYDGAFFEMLLSETRGTFFTVAPNQYGICGLSAGAVCGATYHGLLVA